MIVEKIKKSIILSAISGHLTNQIDDELMDNFLKDYSSQAPYLIPKNWKWVMLKDITDYGKNNSVSGKLLSDSTWILELEDIEKNTGRLIQKIKKKDRKSISNKNKFVKGNLLYGKLRPYLNKCIIADEDGYCSTEIVPMNLSKSVIAKYLQIVFLSPYYYSFVNEKSYGTKMPRLGTTDAKNSLIPLPPIEEQQRIVDKIDELFAKLNEIEPIEQELKTVKEKFPVEMKNSILLSAIKGELSIHNINEIVKIDAKLKDKKIVGPFPIPNNWIWLSHNDMFEIIGGSQPPKSKFSNVPKDGYVQLYQTRDYGPNPQPVYVNKCDVTKFSEKGDIILARYGGSLGKVFWAEDGAYNVALAKVIIKYPNLINKKYLYYYYLADLYQSKVKNGNRSAQAGFSKEDLNDLYFPLPPLEEQQRIVDKIEQLLPLCNDIEQLIKES